MIIKLYRRLEFTFDYVPGVYWRLSIGPVTVSNVY